MKRNLFVALIPLGLAIIIAGLIKLTPLSNSNLVLRIDLATLAVMFGLLISGGVGVGLYLKHRFELMHRHALEQTRAAAAADRRRFLQRLDHELKNPLTAIRVGLANVSDADSAQGLQESLAGITDQTLRLSRLTSDLRKLAELESVPIEGGVVNLAELLPEILELAQEQTEAETRHLLMTLPQAPWPLAPVYGDWDLLYLSIYNLLGNALKFSRPGDTIELRAFEARSAVVIEIADTGPGIPEDELPHVWEELYRGRKARGVEGSGLGLALVRAIVERHDGEITLRSRIEQGTVVVIRLPLQPMLPNGMLPNGNRVFQD